MLKEDNDLLTQTDAGTAMGDLVRQYWIPALLSEEVPEPDCPPVQARLLGERLVAFRDTNGRVGLLEEAGSAVSTTGGSTTWLATCWRHPLNRRIATSRTN